MKTPFTRYLLWILASLSLTMEAHAQLIDGEVKKIDSDHSKITLKHGEIQALALPSMQMAYHVSDPLWLQQFHVGDKVRFTVDKVGNQFTVTSIEPRLN